MYHLHKCLSGASNADHPSQPLQLTYPQWSLSAQIKKHWNTQSVESNLVKWQYVTSGSSSRRREPDSRFSRSTTVSLYISSAENLSMKSLSGVCHRTKLRFHII